MKNCFINWRKPRSQIEPSSKYFWTKNLHRQTYLKMQTSEISQVAQIITLTLKSWLINKAKQLSKLTKTLLSLDTFMLIYLCTRPTSWNLTWRHWQLKMLLSDASHADGAFFSSGGCWCRCCYLNYVINTADGSSLSYSGPIMQLQMAKNFTVAFTVAQHVLC